MPGAAKPVLPERDDWSRTPNNDPHANVHAEHMLDRVNYYAYPELKEIMCYAELCTAKHTDKVFSGFPLFVGQVPNLLRLEYIAWCIELLAQDCVIVQLVQSSRKGVCKLFVESADQREMLIREFNGKMLFDLNGVWIPDPDVESQKYHFSQYVRRLHVPSGDQKEDTQEGSVGRDNRLPRRPIVMELPTPVLIRSVMTTGEAVSRI